MRSLLASLHFAKHTKYASKHAQLNFGELPTEVELNIRIN
jgi:hypothetical protein